MAVSGFYKMHCPLKGKATIILTALHFISTVWMGCILLKCGGKCALGLPGTSILNTESCDCYMANKIAWTQKLAQWRSSKTSAEQSLIICDTVHTRVKLILKPRLRPRLITNYFICLLKWTMYYIQQICLPDAHSGKAFVFVNLSLHYSLWKYKRHYHQCAGRKCIVGSRAVMNFTN